MKIQAKFNQDNSYTLPDGSRLKREYEGLTPDGDPFAGRWVLRDPNGALVAFDRYINDLAERHNIELYSEENINARNGG